MFDPSSRSVGDAADRIERIAADVRARAAALVVAASVTAWESLAAARFRQEVDDLARAMRSAAVHVDDAASAVRRHATTVRAARPLPDVLAPPVAALRRALSWLEH